MPWETLFPINVQVPLSLPFPKFYCLHPRPVLVTEAEIINLVFPTCLENFYTLCIQVLIERKLKERKEKKKEHKGKGEKTEKEVSFSPVFYKPITCLVLESFLHMYYLLLSHVKNILST